MANEKVCVDAKALGSILGALIGPSYLVRELQAITNLPGHDCPIKKVIKDYNEGVAILNEMANDS